jgi:tetratricopeptide (TPR) repeat protein
VVAALKDVPSSLRTDLVQLILARAYGQSGKVKDAISAITSLLNKCDKSGDWLISEPRLIASISGAILALRLGDIDKAKRIYQIVLRNDPEQPHVKKRYKVLRSYMKILTDIEELLKDSKNHDAVKRVGITLQMLEKVLGKDGAAHAGTRLLLFECKAKSAMKFHDDAIEACNTAIEQFENHENPDPRRIAEAYAWRAEANTRDNSFEDAVADLQVALTKVPNAKEYKEKLEEAKEQQERWNKSEEQRDHRGESQGHFYVNRPIKEMLDLPDNIDELDKDTKCKYLKAAFRKTSLRWHPDKAKGGKRRAQRKSAEIGEGKGLLELRFGCKRRR